MSKRRQKSVFPKNLRNIYLFLPEPRDYIMYLLHLLEALCRKTLAKKSSLCVSVNPQGLLEKERRELTVWMNRQQGAFDVDIL